MMYGLNLNVLLFRARIICSLDSPEVGGRFYSSISIVRSVRVPAHCHGLGMSIIQANMSEHGLKLTLISHVWPSSPQ